MTVQESPERAMWEAVERFHAVCYFAPQVRTEGTAAGLKGFWMNYFATRIAPVGPVGPEVAESTFFYYGPTRVARALPDAWTLATPEAIIEARYRGMDQCLRGIFSQGTDSPLISEAAALVAEATAGCDRIGRLFHAGWASLPWPSEDHLALWHGCTLLREYRSGNHLMAVCAAGLDGCEAVVSHVAAGGAPRAWIRDEAGWTEQDEQRAVQSLQQRGWLDAAGLITELGRRGRDQIETMTDDLDRPVWQRLGVAKSQRLFELMSSIDSALPPDDQLDWNLHYPDNQPG